MGAKTKGLTQMLLHVGAVPRGITSPQTDVIIKVETEPVAAQMVELRLGPAEQTSNQSPIQRFHRAARRQAQGPRVRLG